MKELCKIIKTKNPQLVKPIKSTRPLVTKIAQTPRVVLSTLLRCSVTPRTDMLVYIDLDHQSQLHDLLWNTIRWSSQQRFVPKLR